MTRRSYRQITQRSNPQITQITQMAFSKEKNLCDLRNLRMPFCVIPRNFDVA
jgi:hypothetical protein